MYVILDKNIKVYSEKPDIVLRDNEILCEIKEIKEKSNLDKSNTKKPNHYTVYCDGSCSLNLNQKPGGWAYKILETNREHSGSKLFTTNNKMELTAAIMALHEIPQGSRVKIYTDSKYVIDGITKYIKTWKKNSWKTTANKAVLNRDLWEALDKLNSNLNVEWLWVKGHDGDPNNERVDYLAKLSYK